MSGARVLFVLNTWAHAPRPSRPPRVRDDQWVAFIAHVYEGRDLDDIAAEVQRTAGTVRTWITWVDVILQAQRRRAAAAGRLHPECPSCRCEPVS